MVFREESENGGPEARNLPFGRILRKSSKLVPVLPLMPSVGMVSRGDSESDGPDGQNLEV